MGNAEPIKELRECANWIEAVAASSQYANDELMALYYGDKLRDAADALEAADEMIADCVAAIDALDDSNDAYIKENERLKKRIEELEAQLPKKGEWVQMNGHRYCNVCGHKDSPILTNYSQDWKRSCPYCGAKMKGENDESD